MASFQGKEKRHEERLTLVGDVRWSYAENAPVEQFDGTLFDISKSGLNMVTDRTVEEGHILRLVGKGIGSGEKFATVMWCEKVSEKLFRAGLSLNK